MTGAGADGLEWPMTVSEDFTGLTSRFRGELLAHCYRMLGSVDEAEDLVQETFGRAWRSCEGFEGRSSVRTWLYRIATKCVPDRARAARPPAAAIRPGRADRRVARRAGTWPGRAGLGAAGFAFAGRVCP